MPKWKAPSAEDIARRTKDEVRAIRKNAARLGATSTVELCDADLAQRASAKVSRSKKLTPASPDHVVLGFHFVCPTEKGLTRNPDGTLWTGTWVVDKTHAERASKIGAYVALHEAKSKLSYLQGTVKDWRNQKREQAYAEGQRVKTERGIDFLIQLTNKPLQWHGDGAGEKGYYYGEVSSSDVGTGDTR